MVRKESVKPLMKLSPMINMGEFLCPIRFQITAPIKATIEKS